MIHVTLNLPATATELVAYAELVADIDPDVEVCLVGPEPFELAAVIGRREEPTAEEPPAPAKVPKADKRAAPKKAAQPRTARNPHGPTAGDRIEKALTEHHAPWTGSASDLFRTAEVADAAGRKALQRLEALEVVAIERQGQAVRSIRLTGSRKVIRLTGSRKVEPPRQRADLRPVPSVKAEPPAPRPTTALAAPAEIKAPAKGWA